MAILKSGSNGTSLLKGIKFSVFHSKIRHTEDLVLSSLENFEISRNSLLFNRHMNARLHCDDETNKPLRDFPMGSQTC